MFNKKKFQEREDLVPGCFSFTSQTSSLLGRRGMDSGENTQKRKPKRIKISCTESLRAMGYLSPSTRNPSSMSAHNNISLSLLESVPESVKRRPTINSISSSKAAQVSVKGHRYWVSPETADVSKQNEQARQPRDFRTVSSILSMTSNCSAQQSQVYFKM